MAECVALPSYINLHMQRSSLRVRGFTSQNSCLKIGQRKFSFESRKFIRISTWKRNGLSGSGFSNLNVDACLNETLMRFTCLVSLVNAGGVTSDWIPIVDQVLLTASIFLTYMAGVVPLQKSHRAKKNITDDIAASESPTSSGSADDQVTSKHALDAVKEKILDSLDAFDHRSTLGNKVFEIEEQRSKQPLSLTAIDEGPRLRLLLASFQQIEEEVNNISNRVTVDGNDLLKVFTGLIRKSSQPVCMAWLKKELGLVNCDPDKAIVSLIFEKLREDENVSETIRKSGKEALYAELLHFISFGSPRKGCYYEDSLFIRHGTSILEDLVITLADGIASMFLELISVDGSFSNEINSLGLALCNLSTRALQKLRNEMAMNQWLYQNVEAVVSMYEDRFDLFILEPQLIEVPDKRQIENYNWWKRLTLRRPESMVPQIHYTVISHLCMPVKRIKELRALAGWRYYFSLLIELSDITMPLVRAVIDKISSAISFFLVCLIGRSLGLIYTGIRQSLRWK